MTILTRSAYGEPGTSLDFKTGNWRSTEKPVHIHAKAPCHGACPAGEDQQAWFALLQEGRVEAAWRALVAANPLPGVTGRVCPHPCETACNRKALDGALAIHNVERWLGDEAVANGWAYPVEEPPADAPVVAIIGAGPAGVSAAYHALRHGMRARIFEAASEAGGLLRSAIPPTRLPRAALNAELDRVLSLPGIEVTCRARLGRDVSVEALAADHAAVLLAPGCQEGRDWDVGGSVPADHHEGLALLKEFMDHGQFPAAQRVIVHGGGNTAMDLCRLMKRFGVGEVTLVTASGLPGPDTATDDLINVVPRELEEALEEGIEIIPHATVNRLIMRGSKVVGAEVASLKKVPGTDGRKKRVTFEGTERVRDVDMVIPCIGEMVDPEGLHSWINRGYLRPSDHWGTLSDRIYALGDARGDRGTVAEAIGDGARAVAAVAARLNGGEATTDTRAELPASDLNPVYYPPAARSVAPKLPVSERTFEAEIEGDIGHEAALAEAARCLSCGNCLACDNCWTFCPDSAVIKTAELATDGSFYLFDLDYCKGCGLCAQECPTGYIQMRPE
ncbi:FAD-dependent oxidoreductase [Palleronia caenipelagi]|uniref:4Fe-4S dicluster domain-containing protein n=1 Tax=Palleronia caenipelagi TaxID=2489174 RepID=A0A547Q914_9RHOB|nr:FAD-dependent oxidoreductase [Palleronia caenipelagi]TRD22885.1 4Fe-4S dicluster domain-containing protein [Palleronia caenipelagi]